jgi:hypothetical protein
MTECIIEGGCFCGAIRYGATAEPSARTLCHCESCRRASGAPSVAWVIFPVSAFAVVAGKLREHRSSEPITRSFCGDCGTPLAYRSTRRPDVVDVPTATLDEPDAFAPEREIWTGEKLAWETVNASLPQFVRSSKG